MSRSKPDNFAENPATRFFDWAGGEGKLVFYDRDLKENIEEELPFRFLILDEVATVGGGYDDGGSYIGYWSNAIRPRMAKQSEFNVRATVNGKSRTQYRGLWADVKANLTGAKYVKGLYIAFFNEDGNLSIGYLKIRGAALTAWLEFTKDHRDIYGGAFTITKEIVTKKKGTNTYYEPTFSFTEKVKEETNAAAIELDAEVLQPFLTQYFANQAEETHNEPEFAGPQTMAATVGGQYDPQAPGFNPSDARDDDDIPF